MSPKRCFAQHTIVRALPLTAGAAAFVGALGLGIDGTLCVAASVMRAREVERNLAGVASCGDERSRLP